MTDQTLPEYAGHFENLRAGRVCFPRCGACDRVHWYPKSVCPHCQSAALAWHAVSGRGEVFSFTVVRHAFDEKWKGKLPYIVALVTFPDAPDVRFVTNIVGVAPEAVAIGAAVQAVFPSADESDPRVVFRLADTRADRA